jgi:hypothetical protein
MAGSRSLPHPACEINRCKGSLPRPPLPWGPDADEGDHGTVGIAARSGYQINRCVRNDDPPVFAQGRHLEQFLVQPAGLHRLIEAPPMHGPKSGRNDDVKTLAERIVR